MIQRGDRTREQLLDAAEQLFGERGIRNVSLREIRIAAGQGNTAAVQYHFGDRDGIVRAIYERHAPKLEAISLNYLSQLDAMPEVPLRARVEVLARPLADYITQGTSERAWAKMLAELLADPRISMDMIASGSPEDTVKIGRSMFEELERTVPGDIVAERMWAVTQFAVQLCANRARITDDAETVRTTASDEVFAENLVDMAVGALTAPVSPSTRRS